MILKICGLRSEDNIEQVLKTGEPEYIGFIFYEKSKRFVEKILPPDYAQNIKHAKKTGVFVNASAAYIKQKIQEYNLAAVQLHGDETPTFCEEIKQLQVEVIKAFSIDEDFNFKILDDYENSIDYFLFDTKGKERGGNGVTFDWSLLKKYELDKPYFLSGGISNSEITNVISLQDERLYAIDVNSKYEIEPGLKDINEIKKLRTLLDA